MRAVNNIGSYIKSFSPGIRLKLNALDDAIKDCAPAAKEAIKYGMSTYVLNGNLVHFAAFNKHIGFYPTPSAIITFKKELSGYKTSKGAIQFPINKPLPLALIKKIVRFRVSENLTRAKK